MYFNLLILLSFNPFLLSILSIISEYISSIYAVGVSLIGLLIFIVFSGEKTLISFVNFLYNNIYYSILVF